MNTTKELLKQFSSGLYYKKLQVIDSIDKTYHIKIAKDTSATKLTEIAHLILQDPLTVPYQKIEHILGRK